eukprot:c21336_g1_i1 orf=455-2962(-)
MVDTDVDDGTHDCNFPNVRKTFWRSATWSAHTPPPSYSLHTLPSEGEEGVATGNSFPPRMPRTQEHNTSTRSRVHLPLQPLSIARKSFEDWPNAGLDDAPDLASPITPGRRRVKAGLDIKLDLASVHRTIVEPTEIQLRRDKFALFDKQCSRVANYHIYLGSDAVARDREILRANGVTHVLNCVGFVCPEYYKGDLVYKTLWLQDSPCEDITSLLYDVFDYFEEAREQEGRVFVHCCQGVSRSTSFVIAYLMWRERSSFEEAFQDVKAARGVANPNMGFACQLLQCQKRVHAAPMSPKSLFRMYRLAPHSPYDPLHLVPKALSNPGVGSLDSRGAFVIHIPCAIMVWIGRDCDLKMAQAAEEAAGQVIRYERAEGPVKVLTEGNEGMDFWESLSNYYSQQCAHGEEDGHSEFVSGAEKSHKNSRDEVERFRQLGIGNRKVPSNDSDYDLYRIARLGGVIPPVPFTGVGVVAVPTRIPIREDGWSILRRKFLSRELASAKLMLSSEGSNMNNLSPNPSMGSSSPHFSPFSVTSASSAAPTGSDSPFGSPLSSLGFLSPRTPEASATQVSSIICSHPFISSLPIASPLKSSAGPCTSKIPASSLAERRGSVPPTLKLPGLEDAPPPAPRGASRQPKLPPLVVIENHRAENTANVCKDTNLVLGEIGGVENFGVAQPMPSPTSSVQSSESTARDNLCEQDVQIESGSVVTVSHHNDPKSPYMLKPEMGRSYLYLWPGLEKIDMFDTDDLDTRAVFLLVESGCHSKGSNQGVHVYVWVGRQLAASKENQIESSAVDREAVWHQVGQDFVDRMQLSTHVSISVVREGQEPEEFWDTFNQG